MLDAQLDHVAIAVRDIRAAMSLYCDALGATFLFAGDQHDQGFRFAQFRFPGGGKVELVTPLGDGFLQRFIDTHGEGVHHVTLKTPDIERALAHLEATGVETFGVNIESAQWKEAFIHPKRANGTLVQIAQSAWTDEEMARHHLSDHSTAGHRHIAPEDL